MSEDFDILIMLGGLWAACFYRRSAASGLEAAFLLWSLDVSALGEIAAAVELIACVVAHLGTCCCIWDRTESLSRADSTGMEEDRLYGLMGVVCA